jgi:hypothetical protein
MNTYPNGQLIREGRRQSVNIGVRQLGPNHALAEVAHG